MGAAKSYQSYFSFFRTYILPYLPKDKKIKILDIGCGEGHLLYSFKKEGYSNCWGIDSSKGQIEKASKVVSCIEQADMFQYLRENKNKFDLITLFDVAEHLKKKDLLILLKEINKSLNPSGMLIIHTLNAWSLFSRFYFFSDLTHRQIYSPRMIGEYALIANFKKYYYFPSVPEYFQRPESFTSLRALFRFFLKTGQWILWHLISRLYGLVEYIAIGEYTRVYTPNFIIICKKRSG